MEQGTLILGANFDAVHVKRRSRLRLSNTLMDEEMDFVSLKRSGCSAEILPARDFSGRPNA